MARRTRHVVTRLNFAVDDGSIDRDNGGRQIDWAVVPDTYRSGHYPVTVGGAGAAAGATTIPVVALTKAIPQGVTLRFGTDEYATLTAPAAVGATSLSVSPLVSALEAGDTSTSGGQGDKVLLPGTVLCQLTNGKCVPRAARPGAETAMGILETFAEENSPSDALTGYGIIIGGAIYENLLPDATGGPPKRLPTDFKTELAAAGVGTGFAWRDYEDDRP